VDILKRIAEKEISLTQPRAYKAVPAYLRETQEGMGRMEKEER
jgi:hypothetical protein